MELLNIKNLTLGYENHAVLKNLNFTVEEKDFIMIVGPNGSGKSTLVKGILGLLHPMKGTVQFQNLKQNLIGYMPQETKVDKNFPASVYEIVLSGTLNHPGFSLFYNKEQKEKANKVLKQLHIENLKDKKFADLSGGQRQKVLLARSLCATTKLLILDEPSNNLDYKSKMELYNLALKLNEEGITILMVTHDLDGENLIGNKVLSFGEKKVFFGSNEEYRKVRQND